MHFGKFASRKSEARYPSLWHGLQAVWSPACSSPSSSTLYDLSGWNRHGSFVNLTPATAWSRENGTNCIACGNANNRISCRTMSQVFPSTFMIRFSADASQPSSFGGYLFGDTPDGFTASLGLRLQNNTNLQAFSDGGGSDAITIAGAITANTVSHVTYVRASNTSKQLYLNGALVGSTTTAASPILGTSLSLGGVVAGIDITFRGRIFEAAMYQRALTAAEVRTACVPNAILLRRRSISVGSAFRFRRNYSQIFTTGVIG